MQKPFKCKFLLMMWLSKEMSCCTELLAPCLLAPLPRAQQMKLCQHTAERIPAFVSRARVCAQNATSEDSAVSADVLLEKVVALKTEQLDEGEDLPYDLTSKDEFLLSAQRVARIHIDGDSLYLTPRAPRAPRGGQEGGVGERPSGPRPRRRRGPRARARAATVTVATGRRARRRRRRGGGAQWRGRRRPAAAAPPDGHAADAQGCGHRRRRQRLDAHRQARL